MKRYKIQTNYSLGCNAKMIESDGGEWIRYSDYLKKKEEWDNKFKTILNNSCNYFIENGEKVVKI